MSIKHAVVISLGRLMPTVLNIDDERLAAFRDRQCDCYYAASSILGSINHKWLNTI